MNPIPYALGLKSAAQCIQFQPGQPTNIIVIPRHTHEPMITVPADIGFVFHHANAFEQDDTLVIDSVCYDDFPSIERDEDYLEVDFDQVPAGKLNRFRLDLMTKAVESTLIDARSCEFPQVHPEHVGRPYRYVYIGAAHQPEGNAPFQSIWKVDMDNPSDQQIWTGAPRRFIGEPIFIPRPNGVAEDDGWVLTLVFNAASDTSELVILDARDLSQAPVAILKLKHHVPYGLHGSFTCDYLGPDDD